MRNSTRSVLAVVACAVLSRAVASSPDVSCTCYPWGHSRSSAPCIVSCGQVARQPWGIQVDMFPVFVPACDSSCSIPSSGCYMKQRVLAMTPCGGGTLSSSSPDCVPPIPPTSVPAGYAGWAYVTDTGSFTPGICGGRCHATYRMTSAFGCRMQVTIVSGCRGC